MSERKVVFLISSSIGGGAQILLLDLVKALRNEIEMMIICPPGYLANQLLSEGFSPCVSEINARTIKKIRFIVLNWVGDEPFVVNSYLFGTSFYVCKAFRKVKNCKVFSLLLNPIVRSNMPVLKRIAYRIIAKEIGCYSDVIGVGSPELEEEVITLTGKKPVYLENRVPNSQPERRVYFDGSRSLRVCFVGRLAEQKRPDIFLETAKKTAEVNANIEYYMAGEGHLLNDAEEYIKSNNLLSVHLVGFKKDLYSFLNQMDVLLLSSEFENTPLIMLNAMNASLPIVCGNVKGVTHLISNNENGIITEEYSPQAFASSLLYLESNPDYVRKLSQNAYKTALGEFSYKKFVQKYLETIRTC